MRQIIYDCLNDSILEPTGHYPVGHCRIDLADASRKVIEFPDGWLIPILVYFPLNDPSTHEKRPRDIEERSIHVWNHVQYNTFSKPTPITKIASGRWPVLFMNHGFTASSTDYAMICEDLASHGYIVVSILHQLYTDKVADSQHRREKSMLLYARNVENIIFTFDWLNEKKNSLFNNNINLKRIGLVGHSMGSNTILLLANRTFNPDPHNKVRTLLPHNTKVNIHEIKECAVLMDFNDSIAYPQNCHTPFLFQISEERRISYEGSGIYNDLRQLGHQVNFYPHARHISFLDHGYLEPVGHQMDGKLYFPGNQKQREDFFQDLRRDALLFLNAQLKEL